MGLLSPCGVRSHEEQIMPMIELAAKRGLSKIYLPAFFDDPEVPPNSPAGSLLAILGVERPSAMMCRSLINAA
jgi:2,3-bisphosphoglycerate-independent phosphoglycerate mutase